MSRYQSSSRPDPGRRVVLLWRLLLLSALLIVPVLFLLPLAYAWRGSGWRTVYSSHFRAVIRYAWFLVIMILVAAAIPFESFGFGTGVVIAFVLIPMFIVAFAAIEGKREAVRGNRYEGVLS